MNKKRVGAIIAGALLVGGVGTGIAVASIPDSGTGVFTGCRLTGTGGLRLIDKQAGASCNFAETQVQWNQAGPAGPAGATGATGAIGATGPQGPAGESGATSITQVTQSGSTSGGEGGIGTVTATCPSGFVATGGGFTTSGSTGVIPKKMALATDSYTVTLTSGLATSFSVTVGCIQGTLS